MQEIVDLLLMLPYILKLTFANYQKPAILAFEIWAAYVPALILKLRPLSSLQIFQLLWQSNYSIAETFIHLKHHSVFDTFCSIFALRRSIKIIYYRWSLENVPMPLNIQYP